MKRKRTRTTYRGQVPKSVWQSATSRDVSDFHVDSIRDDSSLIPELDLRDEVRLIKERNFRVEREKTWETSFPRRVIITVVTYLLAAWWLVIIHDSLPWLKAVVPAAGYFLSTLSLFFAKKMWLKRQERKERIRASSYVPPPIV